MNAIDKLKKVSDFKRLFNRKKLISKNNTHYSIGEEVAEYFECDNVVKHSEVDLSVFSEIIIISFPNDELVDLENVLT